jgi:Protein of unknown function (DUF1360)
MNDWILIVMTVLATWRVTHLLANEDGPGDIIFRIRTKLGYGLLGSLMDCFNCLSFWVAAPAAFLLTSDIPSWVVSWLALSGAACLLERLTAQPAATNHDVTSMEGDNHVLR